MINTIKEYTKEELKQTGVYKITCKANNKFYIGSACATKSKKNASKLGFNGRWYGHLYKLRLNKHTNPYLQNCYNLYGEDSLIFEIIEICSIEEAIKKEYDYINLYKSYDNLIGFNILRTHLANYTFGKDRESMKLTLSLLYKGKTRPLDIVKKWSKEIQQLDENQNVIATYYSIAEAGRQTNISRQDIGQAAIHKHRKAGGFYWRKVKDIV